MQRAILVAGTSTGVGKTVVTMAIAAYCQTFLPERSLAIFKPVETGQQDRPTYHDILSLQQNPDDTVLYSFQQAIAPPLAAEQAGTAINLADIWRRYQALQQAHQLVIMEACGSLGTPLTPETTVADLAWDWRLPTVLVVPVGPEAIGQAIAHVALARQARVHLKGIILNSPHPLSLEEQDTVAPVSLLQALTQVPVLGSIPYLENGWDVAKLSHVASQLDLERILPFF